MQNSTSKITWDKWRSKKIFSVLTKPLLSEREVQTFFEAIERFTCEIYGTKKIYFGW